MPMPHSRDRSCLPKTGKPSRSDCVRAPRWLSTGALIAGLAALVTLLGVSESSAACSSPPEGWRPTRFLTVQCTDGVCTDGFVLHAAIHLPDAIECGAWIWVMDDLEPVSDPLLQAIQALRVPVATGIYRMPLRECGSLSPADLGTLPSADGLGHYCPMRSDLSLLRASDEPEAFERMRARWRTESSPNLLMARLEILRYTLGGFLAELAISLAALAAPFLLIAGKSVNRSRLFKRVLICASIQVTALGFAIWRFQSEYLPFELWEAEFLQTIDLACAAVIVLAIVVLVHRTPSATDAMHADG